MSAHIPACRDVRFPIVSVRCHRQSRLSWRRGIRAGCDPERKFGLFAVPALRRRSRGRRERLCLARKPTASVPLLYSYPQFRYSWLRSSNEVNSNDYDIPFWWSVAPERGAALCGIVRSSRCRLQRRHTFHGFEGQQGIQGQTLCAGAGAFRPGVQGWRRQGLL